MAGIPRVALVGAGNMGSLHARVISQSEQAELAYLIDPREQVGRRVAERFGAQWLPELPELDNVDAVVVAAATEAHYGLAKQVLETSTPLLVEKPIADNLAHTEELVALAAENDTPLMCGLLERFNPAIMTARQLISEPIHIVATRHSPYAPRIRTGVSWDLLVHDVDLAIQLMRDEPTSVDAHLGFFHPLSEAGAEDVAETILGFERGGIARISASRMGQRKTRKLSVFEQDRLIEIDLLRRDVTIYHHISATDVDEGRGFRQQTTIELPELISNEEPLTAQFKRFMQVLEDGDEAVRERATLLPSHRVVEQVTAHRPHLGE